MLKLWFWKHHWNTTTRIKALLTVDGTMTQCVKFRGKNSLIVIAMLPFLIAVQGAKLMMQVYNYMRIKKWIFIIVVICDISWVRWNILLLQIPKCDLTCCWSIYVNKVSCLHTLSKTYWNVDWMDWRLVSPSRLAKSSDWR